MTPYRYRAARPDGAIVRGTLIARTVGDAAAALTNRGLHPLAVEPQSAEQRRRSGRPFEDSALLLRALATLVGAGIPLQRAVEATGGIAGRRCEAGIRRVLDHLRQGASLPDALSTEPGLFPPVTTGLVRTAESGVDLARALGIAADHMERAAEVRARLGAALTYPLLLVLVGLASIGLILFAIVPRFASLIAEAGGAVPPLARFLLLVSQVMRGHGVTVGAALLVGCVAIVYSLTTHRQWWDARVLDAPVIGGIRHRLAAARAARAMSAVLAGGGPALIALDAARHAVGDRSLAARVEHAQDLVTQGHRLSSALGSTNAFTALLARLAVIGEESGQLSNLLEHGANLEERAAERALNLVIRIVEPALILALAAGTALVAGGMLQAVYGLRIR